MPYSEIEYVKEPKWSNSEYTTIDCIVKFKKFKFEVPYTAASFGIGNEKLIFDNCLLGKYGDIAAFQAESFPDSTIDIECLPETFRTLLSNYSENLQEANKENAKNSFRGVVIAESSLIENLLKKILSSEYSNSGTMVFKKLIKLSHESRLIDKNMYDRLNYIRKIRNLVAHNIKITLEMTDETGHDLAYYIKKLYDLDHSELLHYEHNLEYLWRIVFGGSAAIAHGFLNGIYLNQHSTQV